MHVSGSTIQNQPDLVFIHCPICWHSGLKVSSMNSALLMNITVAQTEFQEVKKQLGLPIPGTECGQCTMLSYHMFKINFFFAVADSVTLKNQGANMALLRPTWQSSVYYCDVAVVGSWLAVDGNKRTEFYSGSCAATSAEPDGSRTWWAVDLGLSTYVDRLCLTNREG
jgi:hypothetical protein